VQLRREDQGSTLRPQERAAGTVGTLLRVAREGGWRALFVGATARVMKRASSTAITWTLFEEAMRRSGGGGG